MTDWYVFLTPAAVAAILALVRFVGCSSFGAAENSTTPPPDTPPGTKPLPPTQTPYATVIKESSPVLAYWRLGEASGNQAIDQLGPPGPPPGKHPATYMTVAPPGMPADANLHSAAAAGTVARGQPPLRKGDALTCALLDGGFVEHAFTADLNPNPTGPGAPKPGFSLEAWVKPNWPAEPTVNYHVVAASFQKAPGNAFRGFVLLAGPDPASEGVPNGPTYWQVHVGVGAAGRVVLLGPPVEPGTRVYLVASAQAKTVSLWVNINKEAGDKAIPEATTTMPADYVPNGAGGGGTPLYIGAGRIGTSPPSAPRFPFKGWIQDVALYSRPLVAAEVVRHFLSGDGEL